MSPFFVPLKTAGYAYVADYEYGLVLIDISNPAAPVGLGRDRQGAWTDAGEDWAAWAYGLTRDVAASGSYVYVAGGGNGLLILRLGSRADFDADGDVDLTDFAIFQLCFNGPNRPPGKKRRVETDFDHDADVDQSDFGIFQRCYSGENIPANPSRANRRQPTNPCLGGLILPE
jgi:hypothetical protein